MRLIPFFSIAALVVASDQLSKHWVVTSLPFDSSRKLIEGILYFTRTTNTGAAFGVFPHSTVLLALMALVAAFGIGTYAFKSGFPLPTVTGIGLALPLGGALGNFIDRARLGHVVDFIEVRLGTYTWPIFNIADSAICVGVALLLFAALAGPTKMKTQQEKTLLNS